MIRYKIAGLVLPMALAMSGACLAATSPSSGAGPAQLALGAGPAQLAPAISAHPEMTSGIQLAQATSTTTTTVETFSPNAPPPPQLEAIPAPPQANPTIYFWRPGHWNWNGVSWNWMTGQYIQRPQPAAAWQPGQWIQQPTGWSWVEGHWQ